MSIVIYSKQQGVFLGAAMGMGFWSKIDAVGQSQACTFESKEEAKAISKNWDIAPPSAMQFIEVNTQDKDYATISECMAAGMDGWFPDGDAKPTDSTIN